MSPLVNAMSEVSIIIADDDDVFRGAIRDLIERDPGIKVIGEAADGRECVRQAQVLSPDIVLVDVVMPVLGGIEATREILVSRSNTQVIALSLHSDSRFIEAMQAAGAAAYVLKNRADEELLGTIREVASGKHSR